MNTHDMPVIELSGSPKARGYHYGKTAKPLIASVLESWLANLGSFAQNSESRQKADPDQYLKDFYRDTDYLSAIKKWAPDLLEEAKGIAEGAEQSFEHILGIQLADEEWIYGLRRGLDKPTEKCTAFGVADGQQGISYAGQNMDIGRWVEGKQVLLRVMPTANAPEALVFTKAGSIGLNGVNANGLGITCNTLAQLNEARDGLPVSFIVRSVLQKQSIDEAEDFIRRIPHASGQNYILSSAGDMRCFECCGSSVVRYIPEPDQGRVFHSNHPLVNTDENHLLPPERRRNPNTLARLDSICQRLGENNPSPSLASIKAALAAHDNPDHPVSRNIDQSSSAIGFTAGASIYEFTQPPKLHLAAGPPCETEFLTFEFKTLTALSNAVPNTASNTPDKERT